MFSFQQGRLRGVGVEAVLDQNSGSRGVLQNGKLRVIVQTGSPQASPRFIHRIKNVSSCDIPFCRAPVPVGVNPLSAHARVGAVIITGLAVFRE